MERGERIVRYLQGLNLMSLATICFFVITLGRTADSLSTYEAFNARSRDVIHWELLQPLMQMRAFNERRDVYDKVTRGALKDERHRAIAAGVCSEEGVDVAGDKEAGYTLEGLVPYAFFLHLHDCLRKVEGHPSYDNFFMFRSDFKHFDPPIPANASRLYQFGDYGTSKNPFAISYRKELEAVKANTSAHTPFNPIRIPMLPPYGLTWPDYKSFYHTKTFDSLRTPVAVVAGKYTTEWGGPPVNYIATRDRLEPILDTLLEHNYFIIYNRPSVMLEGDTSQNVVEAHDFDLIREKYSDKNVIILQDIEAALLPHDLDQHTKNLAKNTLLLELYASTSLFVSTQGGNAVIASLFPADNFLLHSRGSELLHPNAAMPTENDFVYPRWSVHGRSRTFPFIYFDDLLRNLQAYLKERAILADQE